VAGLSASATAAQPRTAVDCPDGLARCEEGTVSVSRLATLPMPCSGPASACSCPWEVLGDCPGGCAADGMEIVVERARAVAQLCAPGGDSSLPAAPPPPPAPDAGDVLCEEGQRYLCAGGGVVECASRKAVGRCVRGCFAEGTSIDDDGVNREAAFAILCSR
jgi:hypothetical protein